MSFSWGHERQARCGGPVGRVEKTGEMGRQALQQAGLGGTARQAAAAEDAARPSGGGRRAIAGPAACRVLLARCMRHAAIGVRHAATCIVQRRCKHAARVHGGGVADADTSAAPAVSRGAASGSHALHLAAGAHAAGMGAGDARRRAGRGRAGCRLSPARGCCWAPRGRRPTTSIAQSRHMLSVRWDMSRTPAEAAETKLPLPTVLVRSSTLQAARVGGAGRGGVHRCTTRSAAPAGAVPPHVSQTLRPGACGIFRWRPPAACRPPAWPSRRAASAAHSQLRDPHPAHRQSRPCWPPRPRISSARPRRLPPPLSAPPPPPLAHAHSSSACARARAMPPRPAHLHRPPCPPSCLPCPPSSRAAAMPSLMLRP